MSGDTPTGRIIRELCAVAAGPTGSAFPARGFLPPYSSCPVASHSPTGVYWPAGFAFGLDRVLIGEPPESCASHPRDEALWLAAALLASVDTRLLDRRDLGIAIAARDEAALAALDPKQIALSALLILDTSLLRIDRFAAMSLWPLEWDLADLIRTADGGPGPACACAGELDVPGHESEAWSYLMVLDESAQAPTPIVQLPVAGFRPRYVCQAVP